MIRVRKPAEPPAVLRTKGATSRRSMSAAYSRDPQAYEAGTKSFEFDSGLYGHATVKQALLEAQHGKCAFCESKFVHIAYGDVEHFRPKAGWRQEEGEPLGKPGYYWLAYAWVNLFLSCTLCNQQFKRNLFPLQTPARRARNHKDDVLAEDPLLLDPAVDDPEAFISFREEVPYAVQGSARGEATIRTLGLRREALAERRRDRLGYVKALRNLVKLGGPEAVEAQDLLQRMQQNSAEYASMTRAFLR
ncbi:hypothetical protein [Vitiosangium sp. GDMCC 1.1324]|uniref:hypothetical protein n=1 Tax=Vitiosangium sp. (strain GDMCC 1.1324) TaxID=2138576 RepID=UPI000D35F146|nr:hypothetical protein [Vitiosangium sp. GDMCC 1.1324]PTL76604.1 hypothetical protein DAT35_49235 [Vitiosangium sp. GDMCC 1.1324]